jgi:hypothetical protein
MAETKKLLVGFDPAKPNAKSNDFLIPYEREGRYILLGLKSGREHAQGMVVYVGRSISENDLFAKLVDSCASVSNNEETFSRLRVFVDKLQALKIGNIVRIIATGDGFELEVLAKTPTAAKT